MANEINWNCGLTIAKNGISISQRASGRVDMTGNNIVGMTQDIGTSAEAIVFGDVSGVPPKLYIENTDTTNFVLIGFTNPPTEMQLKAGEAMLLRPTTATIYAKADTAAVRIFKLACEP